MKLKALDLFSGAGGMTQGIINAGFELVASIDFDRSANKYNKLINGDVTIIDEDIFDIDLEKIPKFDVLFSSLPVQNFSIASQCIRDRNLLSGFIKVIENKSPSVIVIETSDYILSKNSGEVLERINKKLNKLGYSTQRKKLSLFEYGGSPYCSSKLYIVGFLDKKINDDFSFPSPIELEADVTQLIDFEGKGSYRYLSSPDFDKLQGMKTGFYRFQKDRMKPIENVNEQGKVLVPRGISTKYSKSGIIIKDKHGARNATDSEMMALLGFNHPEIRYGTKYIRLINVASPPIVIERIGKCVLEAMCRNKSGAFLKKNGLDYKQGIERLQEKSYLEELLDIVEQEKNSIKKGKDLEKLMEAFFSSIDGFHVTTNISNTNEEIDISIRNESKDLFWNKELPFIMGECKNWSKNIERKEIDIFHNKIVNRNGRAKTGYFISWNGFTRGSEQELIRFSRDKYLIILVNGEQIRQAILENRMEDSLKEWYANAVYS